MSAAIHSKKSRFLFGAILLLAVFLRFYGLERRLGFSDEGNYRVDMRSAYTRLLNGEFRNHGLDHIYTAPHGYVSMILSYFTGRIAIRILRPFVFEHPARRDNFFARFSFALLSILTLIVLYALSVRLFGTTAALMVFLLGTLSPDLIIWGRSEYTDIPMTFFIVCTFWLIWRTLDEQALSGVLIKALAAGSAMGLALGTKWSALFHIPFCLFAYYGTRGIKTGRPFDRQGRAWGAAFLCSMVAVMFVFHSWADFKWAIFPPKHDVDYPFIHTLFTSMPSFFLTRSNFMAVFYLWAGPLFILLWPPALAYLGKHLRLKDPRAIFVGLFLIGGYVTSLLSRTELHWWRALPFVFAAFLSTGFFFERLSPKQMRLVSVLLLVSILPFSVKEGWRIGRPLLVYPGNDVAPEPQLRWDDNLEGLRFTESFPLRARDVDPNTP